MRKRHEADLAALQGRLDDESAAWRAKVGQCRFNPVFVSTGCL
jgi:hypothetical protein